MTAIYSEDIDDCNPCKYCGQQPKLITKYHEDGDKIREISCQSDDAICTAFSYVEVNSTIDDAIKQWNIQNTKI